MFRQFVFILAVFSQVGMANAANRIALIIGNSNYQHNSSLQNPTNDANDVAAALRRLNFKVYEEHDLGYEGMRKALIKFGHDAIGAEMAVVYYAGHGMEVNKHNFLIPTDAILKNDIDIENEAISLDRVMSAVSTANGLKLVILDACRNNPFAAKIKRTNSKRSIGRGLAAVEPVDATLVVFAAKEGTVADDGRGRNSPFTTALLEYIETPGLEVNILFRKVRDRLLNLTDRRQLSFQYGSLPGEEIFLKSPTGFDGLMSGLTSFFKRKPDAGSSKFKKSQAKPITQKVIQPLKEDTSVTKLLPDEDNTNVTKISIPSELEESWFLSIYSGLDFRGADLSNHSVQTQGDCELLCEQDSRCRFFSYVAEASTSTCYLKTGLGVPTFKEGVVSGFYQRSIDGTEPASLPIKPFDTYANKELSGWTETWERLDNANACAERCTQLSWCNAFTFHGHQNYPKDVGNCGLREKTYGIKKRVRSTTGYKRETAIMPFSRRRIE